MVLDLLTAKKGRVCVIINQICCTYTDQSQRVATNLEEIWKHTHVIHAVMLDNTSFGFAELWGKLTTWLPNFAWLKAAQVWLEPEAETHCKKGAATPAGRGAVHKGSPELHTQPAAPGRLWGGEPHRKWGRDGGC